MGCQRGMDGWGAEGTGKGQEARRGFGRRKLKITQEERNYFVIRVQTEGRRATSRMPGGGKRGRTA